MYDLIIENANLVTCDKNHNVFRNASMAITDGKIQAIEDSGVKTSKKLSATQKINAQNKIVMPGLINMHCHAADSLFRGLVEELSLEAWLQKVWVAEKAILTPKTTYTGSVLGLAENLLAGVTSVMDMFWYPTEAVKAAHDLGMRISTGGIFFDYPGIGNRSHEDFLQEAEKFFKDYNNTEDVFPAVMPHGAYTVSPEHLKDAKKIAEKYNGLYHIHAAETLAEQSDIKERYGEPVIRHLHSLGLLDQQAILAHCVHLDDAEIQLIADNESIVVHNPMSNLKLGSGIAPIEKMFEAGVTLALGTDGAISGNDLDMWLTMRLAASLPKGNTLDPKVMNAKTVLHMATLNGAKALGKEDKLGSLEVGKIADFIFVDMDKIHAVPVFDPITHLIYSACKSDISDVFIGGKQVVKDGIICTFDINNVVEEVRALSSKIAASLG
jgi:5-methylthioadenosine/S-adenosylhomocysteine deaminase